MTGREKVKSGTMDMDHGCSFMSTEECEEGYRRIEIFDESADAPAVLSVWAHRRRPAGLSLEAPM
jgi:hypothetical protein